MTDASLWVARGIASGTFEYAFRAASIRATGFVAPSRGASRAQPDGFENPGRATWGGGPGAVIRLLRDNERHDLTLTIDTWLAIAPSLIDSRCVEDCKFASGSGARRDMSAALMFNQGLQYRVKAIEQLAFTLSFTLQTLVRNHEVRPRSALGGRSKVRMGAPHPLFDFGIEWTPIPALTLGPLVGWIAPPGPMAYGPTVTFVARFHGQR